MNVYVVKVLFVKLWREQEKPTRTKRKERLSDFRVRDQLKYNLTNEN